MKNTIVTLLLASLLWVMATPVSARKWISNDGKFSVEAELVEAKNGNVRLKRQDGVIVTVPLANLSKADRDYLSSVGQNPSQLIEVVAEGTGETKKNALKDAFRSAVQRVVGAYVDAETLIKNDELVEDKVLIYSDGFVKTYETISEQEKNGLITIKIRAKIERRSVIDKLKAVNITTRKIDGQGLFAEIVTNMAAKKDATALLKKALADFPTLVTAESAGKPKFDQETSEFVIDVLLKVDTKAYAAHQQRLEEVLAKICLDKGSVSITAGRAGSPVVNPQGRGASSTSGRAQGRGASSTPSRGASSTPSRGASSTPSRGASSTPSRGVSAPSRRPGKSTADVYFRQTTDIQKLLTVTPLNGKTSTGWTVWVNSFRNATHSSTRWNGYVVDADVGECMEPLTGQITISVGLLDADGELITEDEFERVVDRSDNLTFVRTAVIRDKTKSWQDGFSHYNLERNAGSNTGSRTSSSPTVRRTRSSNLFGRTSSGGTSPTSSKANTTNLYIAPYSFSFAFGQRNSPPQLLYQSQIVVQRRIKVTLDELMRVADIKCKTEFRPSPAAKK